MDDLAVGDLYCWQHGARLHISVHEAGHAVSALDHGIRFTRVRFLPDDEQVPSASGGVVPAGVELVDNSIDWVPDDPVRALEFYFAGAAAENIILTHNLERSYLGDLRQWRIAVGRKGELPVDELDELLGEPLADVWERTCQWVSDNTPGVELIARYLNAGAGLTEHEVRSCLRNLEPS